MTQQQSLSTIVLSVLLAGGGLVLLVGGGELLVSAASKLARRLGMSSLLIGLTVVAFGTSLPELFVSVAASLSGYPALMIGNVVGSNIANVGLILGVSLLYAPLRIHFEKIAFELYFLIGATLLVVGIAWHGQFGRLMGLVFVAAIGTYTYLAYRQVGANHSLNDVEEVDGSGALPLLLGGCAGGLVLLALGSDIFIKGAVDLARYFGISELIIGLTLAALGTSLPELATCFSCIRRQQSDILVGNVVGSNLFNLLMVMGSTAVLTPFAIEPVVLHRDLPFMAGLTVVLLPMVKRNHQLKRWQGALMLTTYAVYIAILAS